MLGFFHVCVCVCESLRVFLTNRQFVIHLRTRALALVSFILFFCLPLLSFCLLLCVYRLNPAKSTNDAFVCPTILILSPIFLSIRSASFLFRRFLILFVDFLLAFLTWLVTILSLLVAQEATWIDRHSLHSTLTLSYLFRSRFNMSLTFGSFVRFALLYSLPWLPVLHSLSCSSYSLRSFRFVLLHFVFKTILT